MIEFTERGAIKQKAYYFMVRVRVSCDTLKSRGR
jgi:hypothetical protein